MADLQIPGRVIALGVLASFGSFSCAADELPFQFYSLETHDIKSTITGQTFRITVQLPIRLKDESERFPVLYITDAQSGSRFEELNLWLQWYGEVPRFIAVNIGYPSWAEWQIRQRDLTPTEAGPITGYSAGLIDLKPALLEGLKSGGAAEFLQFIRTELKPYIDENYPTLPTADGYFGNSLGGLFGMFVLLNQPETFSRYILGSPSLQWDGGVMLKQAGSFAESGESVRARVFMAAGSRESEGMKSSLLEIAHSLGKVKGLEVETRIFPDESHATALPLNYSHGVRWAYQQPDVYFLDAYEMALKDQAQEASD